MDRVHPAIQRGSHLTYLVLRGQASATRFRCSDYPVLRGQASTARIHHVAYPVRRGQAARAHFYLYAYPVLRGRALAQRGSNLNRTITTVYPHDSTFTHSDSSVQHTYYLVVVLTIPASVPSSPYTLAKVYSVILLIVLSELHLVAGTYSCQLADYTVVSLSLVLPLPIASLVTSIFRQSARHSVHLCPVESNKDPTSQGVLINSSPIG